jgi:transcriptional regulator GlxA family with amidase domain
MAKSDSKLPARIGVVAYPGCSSWITAGLLEIFAIANLVLGQFGQSKAVKRRFEFHAIAAGASRSVRASQGVRFSVAAPLRRYDAIIVPPLWCDSIQEFSQRVAGMKPQIALLQQLARRTQIVASSCSGAVLLANAGLLEGHRATTCWWLIEWFRKRFPEIDLHPEQLLVTDGSRWTAAAGSAYMHLGIELVREFAGAKVANMTSRLMLVEPRRGTQSPFLPAATTTQHEDADIKRAISYLEAHTSNGSRPLSIKELSRKLAISERTLARKFQAHVGMSPLGYLQSRRIATAKQLLENSALTLDQIVERCGYEDIASFRKLFSRLVGMTPREYRSRFAEPERANASALLARRGR